MKRRNAYIGTMRILMWLAAVITAALTLFLLSYVLIKGLPNISWELLSTKPSYLRGTVGILPDILNTLYIILTALLFVLPLGVGAAVYLTEYAANKKLVGVIEYALDLLMIAKYFERIGDHCTNIAEWVEFSVTGVHKNCQ